VTRLSEEITVSDVTWRLGTRGSRLSLRQADLVAGALRQQFPGVRLETVVVQTAGDRAPEVPIEDLEGTGFFAAGLETALLDNRCDIAVHSAKDLPTEPHGDLRFAAFPAREDPRDVMIARDGLTLTSLPGGARMATSSIRRGAQLLHLRPDLQIVSIRGNIDTRLAKLDRGTCDALVLAGAGLLRMGWEGRVTEWLSPEIMLPAPGQGAMAVQVRSGDPALAAAIGAIDHYPTRASVEAERAFVARLGSGCRAPAAALATLEGDSLMLEGMVARGDGSIVHRYRARGSSANPEELGRAVAEHLLAQAGAFFLEKTPPRGPGQGAAIGQAAGDQAVPERRGAP
jgi:hydroxymethylbilane synthase